jgi:hypothetical protein
MTPADRSKIELDRRALVELEDTQARDRDAERVARGEQALGLPSTATPSAPLDDRRQPDKGDLRIGDADRDVIAEVLSQHMADGRLMTDEREGRLGALYTSQTRAQARSVLAGLPPLEPAGGEPHEPTLGLPDWTSALDAHRSRSPEPMPLARPSRGVTAPGPTDGELNTAYRRWQAKAEKMNADKAAHQQAEASGDPREPALALKLRVSRGEEKSARAKLDELRKHRPDWVGSGSRPIS